MGSSISTTLKKEVVDGLLSRIESLGGDTSSFPRALSWLLANWNSVISTGDDAEKQELKRQVAEQAMKIVELEKQLKEKDKIIESLRDQDPKLLKEKMRIEWEREKLEKQLRQQELQRKLKQYEVKQRAAIEAFKALCKSGKLSEAICEAEMGEFIRKSLGLDEILKEGESGE